MTDWGLLGTRLSLFGAVLPRALASTWIAARGDTEAGVPPSRRGPLVVGETAIDELFIAINAVTRNIPPMAVIGAYIDRCEGVADEFAQLGMRIHRRPDVPRVLSRQRRTFGTTRFDHIDFDIRDVALPDSVAGLDPYAGTASSVRVVSRGTPGRRWLIWVHGAAQGRSDDMYSFRAAHLHGVLDFDVAFPVLPAHGGRRRRQIAYPGMDPLSNVVLTVRAIAEIRALIGWIGTYEPAEIILAGTSLGGPIAAVVSGLESVSKVMAVVPMLDMHGTLAHHMDRAGGRGRELGGLMRADAVTAVSSVMDPLALTPTATAENRMVVAALNDRVTSLSAARQLHAHWDGHVEWFAGSHVGAAMAPSIHAATDRFLAETIA
ncbi:MAG: abhydrolase domain-containing 18 [Gordonia sp. (in: high G+C Gram-positive bacteria)]